VKEIYCNISTTKIFYKSNFMDEFFGGYCFNFRLISHGKVDYYGKEVKPWIVFPWEIKI